MYNKFPATFVRAVVCVGWGLGVGVGAGDEAIYDSHNATRSPERFQH